MKVRAGKSKTEIQKGDIKMKGGYRAGAGRPKGSTKVKARKPTKGDIPVDIVTGAVSENLAPLEYMLQIMNDPNEDMDRRFRAAIAAAPFVHPRKGEGSGREDKKERAKAAGGGKFAPGRPPLSIVRNKD